MLHVTNFFDIIFVAEVASERFWGFVTVRVMASDWGHISGFLIWGLTVRGEAV